MPALTVFTYTQIENIMLGLNEYLSSVRMAGNNLKLYAYLLIQPEPNEKINLIENQSHCLMNILYFQT